ncbi:hypothetical protein MUK42_22298 [Musa troglodytarum]|uniref:Uncharacterized protein n=1 Tax=Musa troglodytarum TaxID=320322 RepID=A0A9E7GBS8_9LILI|nr:hypothetical protein MUK42_22298 [Musa troglodytarum]URE12692.1 hypothetical protein MUK42_22298 [Musa troglodytarum]
MATSFFLWPFDQHKTDDGGGGGATAESKVETPTGKAKGRKGCGAKAVLPKRPPQRGLGVAQLERLRLQERWNKLTELDLGPFRDDAHLLQPHPLPGSKSYGNLVHHQLTPLAAAAVYGAPIALSESDPTDDYLPSYCSIIQAPLTFGGTAIQAVHRDQCLQARFRVGNPSLEPPSCQNPQCEFCARKKRLFGNDLGDNLANGAVYLDMDLAAGMAVDLDRGCTQWKAKLTNERELTIKEFDFFPPNSRSASNDGSSSKLVNREACDAISTSSAAASSTSLDLSLKLSL